MSRAGSPFCGAFTGPFKSENPWNGVAAGVPGEEKGHWAGQERGASRQKAAPASKTLCPEANGAGRASLPPPGAVPGKFLIPGQRLILALGVVREFPIERIHVRKASPKSHR